MLKQWFKFKLYIWCSSLQVYGMLPSKIVCCPLICYSSLFFEFQSVVYHSQYPFVMLFISDTIHSLTLSDPTSDLIQLYDFPVPLRCRKMSDKVFFLRLFACCWGLSEPVRHFSSCSTDFSQQIVHVVLFLFLYVFLF